MESEEGVQENGFFPYNPWGSQLYSHCKCPDPQVGTGFQVG